MNHNDILISGACADCGSTAIGEAGTALLICTKIDCNAATMETGRQSNG